MSTTPAIAVADRPQKFISGPITLYAQLASVLRARILSGEWASGTDIPSIDELCQLYGVGRITVRQALQILTSEGLVSSQRGRRTRVIADIADTVNPLFSSLAQINTEVPNYSIRVLSRSEVDELPAARWELGRSAGPYVMIRKVDYEGARAYVLSTGYIAGHVYERFPKGAEESSKLVRLVLAHARRRVHTGRERIRVRAANLEECTQLGCPISAPLACVERVLCDRRDRVVYYTVSSYRGDRFGLERDLAEYLVTS